MTKQKFHSCVVERLKHVKTYDWNLTTGQKTLKSEADVIEPCDTPLFGKDERATGICNSCLRGWSADGNTPTERGLRQIKRAKQ